MPENLKPETFLRYALKGEHARNVRYTGGTFSILVIDPDRDLRPRSNRRWRMENSSPEFDDKNKHMQSFTPQMTFHDVILRQKEFFFYHMYDYLTPEENERCSGLCRKP
jgi:hypothetical protein